MNIKPQKYCLDANVLIQAWQKYYSPKICPGYWALLQDLGAKGHIFIPVMVFEEIEKGEDDLYTWLKDSKIPIARVSEPVTKCLNQIFASNETHKFLVDNTKNRSVADPWVIAHAISEKACVVTKEEKSKAINNTKVKIPDVCQNMGVRCLNDFQLIEELNIKFTCAIELS